MHSHEKVAYLQTHLNLTPKDLSLKNLQLTVDKNVLSSKRVRYNFAKDTLIWDNFRLKGLGLKLSGWLSANHIKTQPTVRGFLQVARFNPRRLLQRLGQSVPKTDPKVLRTLTLKTELQGSMSKLSLRKLDMRLDNSRLQGRLNVQNFQKPAIAFDLNLDRINIDRYLSPEKAKKSSKPQSSPSSGKDILFPPETLEMLRALNLSGILKVGHLTANNLKVSNIQLNV